MPKGCANALSARFMPEEDVVGGRAIYDPAIIYRVPAGQIPAPVPPA
jgi:hypothetical protein